MKLVKSLLLGSAAGLAAVAGAQAADLPVRKAAPVEYVRVCTAYGAGFFYIPGTDTCLRISGRAQAEYQYLEQFTRAGANTTGYRTRARLNVDARTQTAYGTVRAFLRVDVANRTGSHFSGSNLRQSNGFTGVGTDYQGQSLKYVEVDKAFIQFAGFTAGRSASFFDFYATDYELIGSTAGSVVSSTNLFAYTAQLGNGFTATISMEDPQWRRTPIFNLGTLSTAVNGGLGNQNFAAGFAQPIVQTPVLNSFGNGFVAYDVLQKNRMPDIVGNLRYDAPWGSAQISAAVHELATGTYSQIVGQPVSRAVSRVPTEYGWAVQGGVKVNTPFISAGDGFYLQGAYGRGTQVYSGGPNLLGYDVNAGFGQGVGFGQKFQVQQVDGIVNAITRRLELTEAWSVVGAYLHYWTPEWRSAFFGSYGEVYNPRGARASLSLIGVLPPLGSNALAFNQNLRDYSHSYAGASLIWSPVRDMDIGVEGVYQRIDILNGRVVDNRNLVTIAGVPARTAKTDDQFLVRFRVQRDF